MQAISDIVKEIRAFKKSRGMSNTRLAREAGLHENTLRAIDSPKWNPRLKTVERLQRRILRVGQREDGET